MLKESRDVKVYLFSSEGQTREIEITDNMKMAREFLDFSATRSRAARTSIRRSGRAWSR